MTEELKPCPFCGSAVISYYTDCEYRCVQCAQCGCEICTTKSRDHAIAKWDRRAPAKIRPLVWSEEDKVCTRCSAPALGGKMIVTEIDPGSGEYQAGIDLEGLCFRLIQDEYSDDWGITYSAPKTFPSIEAAKEAAQADYERRIREALA